MLGKQSSLGYRYNNTQDTKTWYNVRLGSQVERDGQVLLTIVLLLTPTTFLKNLRTLSQTCINNEHR